MKRFVIAVLVAAAIASAAPAQALVSAHLAWAGDTWTDTSDNYHGDSMVGVNLQYFQGDSLGFFGSLALGVPVSQMSHVDLFDIDTDLTESWGDFYDRFQLGMNGLAGAGGMVRTGPAFFAGALGLGFSSMFLVPDSGDSVVYAALGPGVSVQAGIDLGNKLHASASLTGIWGFLDLAGDASGMDFSRSFTLMPSVGLTMKL